MKAQTLLRSVINKQKQTVNHDRFDRMVYDGLAEKSKVLEEMPRKINFSTVNELLFDTFNLFFKYKPEFIEDEKIDERFLVNKEILQKAVKTEEYQKLRAITQMNEANSAVATASFVETVIQEIIKRDSKINQKIQELEDLQTNQLQTMQQLSSAMNLLNQLKQQMKGASGAQKQEIQQQIQQQQQQVDNLQQQLDNLQQQIKQQTNSITNSVKQMVVSKAINQASQRTKEVNDSIHAFGWGKEKGGLQKLPPEERLKLADALMRNQKLLMLARELGRMKRILQSTKKEKVKRGATEIYDVRTGDDVQRLLPIELAKLNIEELKMDFHKRYVEKQLMQYELRNRESKGKGDFVACVDVSGSMKGTREIWAKAVALACMEIAIKRKSRLAIVFFSVDVKKVMVFEKPPTLEEIIEVAETFSGGGTDFEKPLTKAVEILESGKFKRADILFITDGECTVSDKFAKEFYDFRKKNEVKVVSVLIGVEAKTLKKVSDRIVEIRDLISESNLVFKELV